MASYLIKKDEKTKEIIYITYDLQGYEFKPGAKSQAYLKINHVTVISPSLIQKILVIKFNSILKKLILAITKVLNSDDATTDDTSLLLDEIARMKSVILRKYTSFLKKEKEEALLLKLEIIEKELRYKELLINEKLFNTQNLKVR